MDEAINNMDNKSILILIIMLFTFVTGNIIFTLYIFNSLKDKEGPRGPQGRKGDTCVPDRYVIDSIVPVADAASS
jgi:hypothetical protein